MPLSAGTRLGPYEVINPIGVGGMGEVYRARDTRLGRDVALKILPAHLVDAESRRRFEQEARSASALTHANIVTIHDVGEADGIAYLAMELVEGRSLRDLLAAGPLPIKPLLRTAVQIADGLAAAHAKGIVHRDLKPENILVTDEGTVKILDFGLAKPTTPQGGDQSLNTVLPTAHGVVLGTAGYMSPEQARGEPVDYRSDQFSFGAILYELATGRRAFARGSYVQTASAVITEEPEALHRVASHVPPPLQWAIDRCLAKRASDRYLATRDLHRDLLAVHDHISNVRAAGRSFAGSNLPSVPTRLVGRDRDVAGARQILARDDVRWLTLTGPGGVGKTRLAVQLGAELRPAFGDSVCFVPLGALTDFRLVPEAIAQALDIRSDAGESALDAMRRTIRTTRAPLLLVIDNFEHVGDAAPWVMELLECSESVKVLATSRSVLHVSAEHEFPVLPLGVPDRRQGGNVDALAACPAVELFVQRASTVRPGFAVTEENAPAIAEICARLDGLPMAIELAAARIKVLTPTALLARLEGRLLSLAGGARDLPARQQTLRSAIDWSYGLLTVEEQRLFRRLAVFAGGWTLEFAEAVCDAREDLGIDILDGIASLVDKSLVQRVERGTENAAEPRFTMLETIREYALERLELAGEKSAAQQAHAAYCLVLAEEGARSPDADSQVGWLSQCDAELANIRAALRFLTERGNSEWGLRLATALLPFWQTRGHLLEAREQVSTLLRPSEAALTTELRVRALFTLGVLLHMMGEYAESLRLHTSETLPLYRELGDRRGIAISLNAAGVNARAVGDFARARSAFEECLSIWREVGDESSYVRTLSNLASLAASERDFAAARRRYQECRTLFQRVGDASGAAWTLIHEGDVARAARDFDAAQALYEDALGRFRDRADQWGMGGALEALGHLALDRGETEAACDSYRRALGIIRRVGDHLGVARLLEAIACAAGAEGRAQPALVLAGAAAALRQTLGVPLALSHRAALESALGRARRHARSTAFWMEGWSMSVDDAVEYALGVAITSR